MIKTISHLPRYVTGATFGCLYPLECHHEFSVVSADILIKDAGRNEAQNDPCEDIATSHIQMHQEGTYADEITSACAVGVPLTLSYISTSSGLF